MDTKVIPSQSKSSQELHRLNLFETKEIREQLHWHAGTQVTLLSSPTGVTLKAAPKKTGRRLEDLIGMLKHDG